MDERELILFLVITLLVMVAAMLWFMFRLMAKLVSVIEPVRESVESQTKIIDKLVTVAIAKGPLEYQAIRAGDSLVDYDKEVTEQAMGEEPNRDEEEDDFGGQLGDPAFDDPFYTGKVN